MNIGRARKLSTTASTRGSMPSCWICRVADVNADRDWYVNTHGCRAMSSRVTASPIGGVVLGGDDDPRVGQEVGVRQVGEEPVRHEQPVGAAQPVHGVLDDLLVVHHEPEAHARARAGRE